MTVVPLQEAMAVDTAGAKASSLCRLLLHGFHVPAGVVLLSHHFDEFLASSGHLEAIKALVEHLSLEDPQGLEATSKDISTWLLDAPLSPSLHRSLANLFDHHRWERVVVRSSAIGEDGAKASFAGQLDSFLDIQTPEALITAVIKCFCSYYSARVLAYQHARGVQLQGMAVLIQPQIQGAVSGVTFTTSPEDPTHLRMECCKGGCEALVSGQITPEVVMVPRSQVQALPPCALLSPGQLRTLVETCLAIEALHQTPQDIEWTLDLEGQLHILQARPITGPPSQPDLNFGEGKAGDHVVYSNANINENFPGPVSPLLQSVARTSYYHYFRAIATAYGFAPRRINAMETPLRHIVDVHGQRLYYNVSNIHAVMRMAPRGELFAKWFNTFVGVSDTTAARAHDMTWGRGHRSRLVEVAELAAIAAHITRQYATLPEQVRTFEATVDRFALACTHKALADADAEVLIQKVEGFLEIRNRQWIGAALSDGACMVCCGALEWFLGRHFEEEPDVLLHGLLRGLPDIVSSEPPRQLWHLSRRIKADEGLRALFDKDTPSILEALGWDGMAMNPEHRLGREVQAFLDDWGFRCTGELMLTVSSFQEDPAPVLDMLRSYITMDSDGPDHIIEAQGQRRLEQSATLAAKLDPVRAFIFAQLHRATSGSLALRERSRLKQALLYRCLRRITLALGARWHHQGLLSDPEDIFFLHWQDILAARHTKTLPLLTIQARKERFARESAWPAAPDSLVLPEGEHWHPAMTTVSTHAPVSLNLEGDNAVLTGIAAAGGKVTARATVALAKEDFHRVKAGDILVAPQTDPGWATVLFLVRGLVMERGGMLSHGAIIAREFGIPSVIAIPHATLRIPQASTLRVDGDKGHVYILE